MNQFWTFQCIFLNNFKDFLEAYSLLKICKIVLEHTLKCSQLISSSDNKKILLTTRNVRLDSGRYATKYYFSIKCLESYGIVKNSNGTFHPTEFHLPICISKAFQFDLTSLNICRVILKFHLACDVKVDPCSVANLAVIVDSYRGWSHKIRRNSQFFSLKREINTIFS